MCLCGENKPVGRSLTGLVYCSIKISIGGPREVTATEGSIFRLVCTVSEHLRPPEDFEWFVNGTSIAEAIAELKIGGNFSFIYFLSLITNKFRQRQDREHDGQQQVGRRLEPGDDHDDRSGGQDPPKRSVGVGPPGHG